MAIEALHSIGIVHHDIKPENILIDAQGHCVLSDFGGSKFLSESGTVSPHPSGQVVGTPPYAAPEVLQEDILEDYDESIDWWSLGATIFSLLTGEVSPSYREVGYAAQWLIRSISSARPGLKSVTTSFAT